MSMYEAAGDESPICPACGSPFLAWQLSLRCVLWRCPRCGHIDRDLRLARAGARSQEYGGDAAGDRVRLELTARRLQDRVGAALSGRVLEIGSGDGRLAQLMARHAQEVVAVDVAPTPVPAPTRVRTVAGRFEDVDLGDGRFDLVVGIHVLEHVADVGDLLKSVRALLVPGGIGYFVTPNAQCTSLRAFGADWWMLEDPTHVRFLSPRSAELLGTAAGFTTVEVRRLLADSLACDGATLARRLERSAPAEGILSRPAGRVLALGVLPVSLPVRLIRPDWRPAIEVLLR